MKLYNWFRYSFPLIVLLLLFVQSLLYSTITSGSDFQKIPKSARAIALGESYTAAMDDVAAIDYNPAALNTLKSIGVSMMYHTWIDNSYGIYGAGGYRLGDVVLGGSLYYLNYGGIKEYDYFGNTVANYNPYDMNAKVAISADGGGLAQFLRGFSVGAGLSYIYRDLINSSIWGLSLDTGLHYKTTLSQLVPIKDEKFNDEFGFMPVNVGFSVQNIGFSGDLMSPMKMNFGMAVGLFQDFYVSFDISKDYQDTPLLYKMGAEYTVFEMLVLRCGFNVGRDIGNFSFGVGIKYPFLFNTLRIDYAYSPLGVMGNNHSISLYGEFLFDVTSDNYYKKGLYFFNKQDFLKARELWRKSLDMNPRDEIVIKKLKRVDELINYYVLESDEEVRKEQARLMSKISNIDFVTNIVSIQSGVFITNQYVKFVFATLGGGVSNISVVGEFNNWDDGSLPMDADSASKPPYTIWKATMALNNGIYQYKFNVNHSISIFDINNPVFTSDGKGGKNSILLVENAETNETSHEAPPEADTNTNPIGQTNQ